MIRVACSYLLWQKFNEGQEGPRSRSRRRRRSRAVKFPASSASLRNELSSWFKPTAQLHGKGREFDMCEFRILAGEGEGGGSGRAFPIAGPIGQIGNVRETPHPDPPPQGPTRGAGARSGAADPATIV